MAWYRRPAARRRWKLKAIIDVARGRNQALNPEPIPGRGVMDTRSMGTELYRAYRAGDGERVSSMIHDAIDWIIHGPAHLFTFEGPRRGKAAVLETLAAIARQFELKRSEQKILIVEGERAAVLSETAFVQRATGRLLVMQLVNFLRVGD